MFFRMFSDGVLVIFSVIAVDVLACKGLDRLEERIPALQYPPDKVGGALICTPTHFIVCLFSTAASILSVLILL